MTKTLLSTCAIALALCASSAPAAIVVGTADTGASNSIPFDSYLGGYYFSEIYNKAKFGAGLTIKQLSFYQTKSSGGAPGTGTFTFWLGTSNAALSTFDTNGFFQYPDASFTKVYQGTLSALVNGRMDVNLTTAFNYSAAQNLVLIVRNDDLSGNGDLFLDVDANAVDLNSRINASSLDRNFGFVTGFNVAPVPEASTWAMMIGGFALAGAALRGRRKAVRFA